VSAGRTRTRLLQLVDRAGVLAEVLLSPGGWDAVRRKPRSLSAYRLVAGVARSGIKPRTVLDVGANVGQFSTAAARAWPAARIIAFEALPDLAEGLEHQLAPGGHVVHAIALGDCDATTKFRRHRYAPSSSVLPSSAAALGRYDWAEEATEIEVPIRRLDTVVPDVDSLPGPVLLKLDVQGFERQVLAGAEHALGSIDALIVEQAFDEFYEGQPLFDELHAELRSKGWVLRRVLDVRREDGVPAEADCLYVRRQP